MLVSCYELFQSTSNMTCKWNKVQMKEYIIITLACCVINVASVTHTTVFWNAEEYKFVNIC
jgi:hypothetical protein